MLCYMCVKEHLRNAKVIYRGDLQLEQRLCHVATLGYPLYDTGDVNSEGNTVLRAAEARTAFGVDSSGLKVGVMSDGVTNLSDSVASGDLPPSPAVDVLKAGSGDEGTAMLEIIHDLAPGASLAFYAPDSR